MPTLNLPPKKKKNYPKRGKNEEIAKIYNSVVWKKLRKSYYLSHPVCEICEKEGKVTVTEEIHHKKPISTGKDLGEMQELAWDEDNLISLCKKHHHDIHKGRLRL